MKKFSLKEIFSIYNYLESEDKEHKKEKLIIAHMLLNSLEQIKCYNQGEISCSYCHIDEEDEFEVELICEHNKSIDYAFKNYSYSRMDNCPFEDIEIDVKRLIKELSISE